MNSKQPGQPGIVPVRPVLLAMALLWVACSANHGGSSGTGAIAECDQYADAMSRCLLQIGGDPAATSRQVDAIRQNLSARAADTQARAELRASCVANRQRLEHTCPSSRQTSTVSSL